APSHRRQISSSHSIWPGRFVAGKERTYSDVGSESRVLHGPFATVVHRLAICVRLAGGGAFGTSAEAIRSRKMHTSPMAHSAPSPPVRGTSVSRRYCAVLRAAPAVDTDQSDRRKS